MLAEKVAREARGPWAGHLPAPEGAGPGVGGGGLRASGGVGGLQASGERASRWIENDGESRVSAVGEGVCKQSQKESREILV